MRSDGCDLYYEERARGCRSSGSPCRRYGLDLGLRDRGARPGRSRDAYDRRGYARSGGEQARSIFTHTTDAAAILESLQAQPAVVVGTERRGRDRDDLAVRRPAPPRPAGGRRPRVPMAVHSSPSVSQIAALAKIGSLAIRGRQGDAAETLLRSAYTYRDGGSAWDVFPEEWRRAGRETPPALADFRNSITDYPSPTDLATVEVPVVQLAALSPTA